MLRVSSRENILDFESSRSSYSVHSSSNSSSNWNHDNQVKQLGSIDIEMQQTKPIEITVKYVSNPQVVITIAKLSRPSNFVVYEDPKVIHLPVKNSSVKSSASVASSSVSIPSSSPSASYHYEYHHRESKKF